MTTFGWKIAALASVHVAFVFMCAIPLMVEFDIPYPVVGALAGCATFPFVFVASRALRKLEGTR